jgi:hypothetical protein
MRIRPRRPVASPFFYEASRLAMAHRGNMPNYVSALRAADGNDIGPLLAFARS